MYYTLCWTQCILHSYCWSLIPVVAESYCFQYNHTGPQELIYLLSTFSKNCQEMVNVMFLHSTNSHFLYIWMKIKEYWDVLAQGTERWGSNILPSIAYRSRRLTLRSWRSLSREPPRGALFVWFYWIYSSGFKTESHEALLLIQCQMYIINTIIIPMVMTFFSLYTYSFNPTRGSYTAGVLFFYFKKKSHFKKRSQNGDYTMYAKFCIHRQLQYICK